MEHRASVLWLVLLSLLGSGWSFQEKAPLQPNQARGDNLHQSQQQVLGGSGAGNVEEVLGSTRNVDDHVLSSIGKAGFKHFMGSSSSSITTTTAKPTVQHQHHYYYTSEGNGHPRQVGPIAPGGYPWPGYSQIPPPPPPQPQRPYVPPYNPWPYGWGHWGGGGPGGFPGGGAGGFPGGGYPGNFPGNPGFPGYPGHGYPGYPYPGFPRYPGYPGYPGYPIYPGYPGFPWYRSAENEELDEAAVQPETAQRSIPGSYQARVLASTSKSASNLLPLYQLLNVARV